MSCASCGTAIGGVPQIFLGKPYHKRCYDNVTTRGV